MQRTHTCGELRAENEGQSVVLNGWVAHRRDHGGVLFIDLRDRFGLTQVRVDPEKLPIGLELRGEYVVAMHGTVNLRPEENRNPERATGDIEVRAHEVEILNRSKTPPFEVKDQTDAREELRGMERALRLVLQNWLLSIAYPRSNHKHWDSFRRVIAFIPTDCRQASQRRVH